MQFTQKKLHLLTIVITAEIADIDLHPNRKSLNINLKPFTK